MDEKLKADFEDVRHQTRQAARSTLVAMRDGLDYLIRKLEERTADAATQGDTQRETDVPPTRDPAFDA